MGAPKLYGCLDAGGTTFKCGIASEDGELTRKALVPTKSPEETLGEAAAFFREAAARAPLAGFGIGSFGPVDIDPRSKGYGRILSTPKEGWSGADIRTPFAEALGLAPVVSTDVNAALLGEMRWGAAKGAASACYVTVGTGIGAGVFGPGGFAAAPLHPEAGHLFVKRHPMDRSFEGRCPFHRDCLEGLASAAAFEARFGRADLLPADHPGWEIEAFYLAQGAMAVALAFRPERIVMGGGLMQAEGLTAKIRTRFSALLNGYIEADAEALIRPAGLGPDAGLLGAAALAMGA